MSNDTRSALDDIKKALQLNPSSYRYHENFVKIISFTKNPSNDFIGYWSLNMGRKIVASLLILSMFAIYFITPSLITYSTETIVSEGNGESTTRKVENARVSDLFIFVLTAAVLIILFSPLLRRAKIGINQIELDFLEDKRTLVATQLYPDSNVLSRGKMI